MRMAGKAKRSDSLRRAFLPALLAVLSVAFFMVPDPRPQGADAADPGEERAHVDHDDCQHDHSHGHGTKAAPRPPLPPLTGVEAAFVSVHSDNPPWEGQSGTPLRSRAVQPLPLLTSGQPLEEGTQFMLPLFDDLAIEVEVVHSFVNVNGTGSSSGACRAVQSQRRFALRIGA
jgi:hypothetical protein